MEELDGAFEDGKDEHTPREVAAAALVRSIGIIDPDEIEAILEETAWDRGISGYDTDYGAGILDVGVAVTRAVSIMDDDDREDDDTGDREDTDLPDEDTDLPDEETDHPMKTQNPVSSSPTFDTDRVGPRISGSNGQPMSTQSPCDFR